MCLTFDELRTYIKDPESSTSQPGGGRTTKKHRRTAASASLVPRSAVSLSAAMFDMFDLPPGLQEQARTVLLTVLFIFAGKGLLSLMTASTTRGRVAEPAKEPAPPKPDKTTIVDSPKQESDAAVPKPADDVPPKPKPAKDDAQDATSKSQGKSGGDTKPVTKPDAQPVVIPKGGEASTTATPKSFGPTTPTTAGPSATSTGTGQAKASSAPPITAHQLFKEFQNVQAEVKLMHADIKTIATAVTELQTIPARVTGIEKVLGVMSAKLGPMSVNVEAIHKTADQGFKENSKMLSSISANVRGSREDSAQEAKDRHTEQGSWLTSTEAKLVEGIKEVLKKITNTDFASSQLYTQKVEQLGSEVLAALHFTQGELSEVKEALTRTGEEVHTIKEMCERPLMATPPQYRAPVFGHGAREVPPAPNYDPHVRPCNVNLQQALPMHGEGITVSPDGRSLNIPLRQ